VTDRRNCLTFHDIISVTDQDETNQVVKTCLPRRCIATVTSRTTERHRYSIIVFIKLRALPSNGRCLQSHCLATGLYAQYETSVKFLWAVLRLYHAIHKTQTRSGVAIVVGRPQGCEPNVSVDIVALVEFKRSQVRISVRRSGNLYPETVRCASHFIIQPAIPL
jgi:hypothetical protein